MGDLLIVVGILAVLVLIVGFWVMSVYNGLVRTRNAKDNNYSQIGIQLTRKYDLIPNLVKLAKGYMKHERATLEEVIQARNQAANANSAVSANPGDPVAFNLRDLVVTARKDQRHGCWVVIQLRTARACSKSALMSSMCSSPTETLTIVGVTPAEACSASLSCWWVVEAG